MKEGIEQAYVAFKKQNQRLCPLIYERKKSSSLETRKQKCYLCGRPHFICKCQKLLRAKRLLQKDDKERKERHKARKQKAVPNAKTTKTPEKKGHRYIAATNNKVLKAYTNTSSNLSLESKNDRQIKVCHLSKENISKKPLSIQASDTAASSYISD